MNRTLKTALSFGLAFSVIPVLSKIVFGNEWKWGSLAIGFFFGAILGVLLAMAMKWTMKNMGKSIVIDLPPGESLVKDDGSAYIKGKAGFPGRLALTDRSLIFKSKKINDKDFVESIDLTTIQSVKERNFWMGPGIDLMITTNDQHLHRFVVYAPEDWIGAIEQKRVSEW
jgi:hypothetical protein